MQRRNETYRKLLPTMSGNYGDIPERQRLRGCRDGVPHYATPPKLGLHLLISVWTLPELQPHCPCAVPVLWSPSPACSPGGSSTCWCLPDPTEQVRPSQWSSTCHPLGRPVTASESRTWSLPAHPSVLVFKPTFTTQSNFSVPSPRATS